MTGGPRILIVGMGNLLLGDDGVGIHLVRALEKDPPRGTTLLDAGTALLGVVDEVALAEAVLVLDAMQTGDAPGTVHVAPVDAVRSPREGASLHDLGLRGALQLLGAGRAVPECLWVLGVEPARMDYGMELSPAVQAAMPAALRAVRRIVDRWQRLGPGTPTLRGPTRWTRARAEVVS
jgi:hydrogenase maturation protease